MSGAHRRNPGFSGAPGESQYLWTLQEKPQHLQSPLEVSGDTATSPEAPEGPETLESAFPPEHKLILLMPQPCFTAARTAGGKTRMRVGEFVTSSNPLKESEEAGDPSRLLLLMSITGGVTPRRSSTLARFPVPLGPGVFS